MNRLVTRTAYSRPLQRFAVITESEADRVSGQISDHLKVLAFLVAAIIARYAMTGTVTSPVDGGTSAPALREASQLADPIDLSSAEF